MANVTLAEIRARAREISDYENSQFVTDTELNKIINEGYAEFYDWVVDRYEDYYLTGPLLTQITTGNTIDLDSVIAPPDEFYKLRSIDYSDSGSGDFYSLEKFNWKNRNDGSTGNSRLLSGYRERRYRIMGRKIYIIPEDQAAGVYRIWFIPLFKKLNIDTDFFKGENGWDKYVSLYAAKFIKMKAEESVADINNEMAIVKERIERLGKNRDLEGVQVVGRGQQNNDYNEEWLFY